MLTLGYAFVHTTYTIMQNFRSACSLSSNHKNVHCMKLYQMWCIFRPACGLLFKTVTLCKIFKELYVVNSYSGVYRYMTYM